MDEITPEQKRTFLVTTRDAASAAGHIWPAYAACEAALESRWGLSSLVRDAFNLFGRKQSHEHPRYETLTLPTKEFLHGEWVTVNADWVKFPDLMSCFRDRMELLQRLSSYYGPALAATSGEQFVTLVSQHWSTDPQRGKKVLSIYDENVNVLAAALSQGDGDAS